VKLTVIGCSPAWPNPGGAHSGYLLESPHGRLLVDCGPGVLARMRERDGWPHVDAIAITHFHLDHWGDLVPWAWFRAYAPGQDGPKPELWVPAGGHDDLATFASFWGLPRMFLDAFDVHEYSAGTPFEAAGFEVVAKKLEHYGVDAYGFRVSSNGKTLAYSGDSAPTSELADLARGATLFLVEATLSSAAADTPQRGHLSAEEALAAADGPVLLTHRPAELPAPEGVDLAHDGLVVDI
jgi:ribonuclease BN (tRNA processing enzyme)